MKGAAIGIIFLSLVVCCVAALMLEFGTIYQGFFCAIVFGFAGGGITGTINGLMIGIALGISQNTDVRRLHSIFKKSFNGFILGSLFALIITCFVSITDFFVCDRRFILAEFLNMGIVLIVLGGFFGSIIKTGIEIYGVFFSNYATKTVLEQYKKKYSRWIYLTIILSIVILGVLFWKSEFLFETIGSCRLIYIDNEMICRIERVPTPVFPHVNCFCISKNSKYTTYVSYSERIFLRFCGIRKNSFALVVNNIEVFEGTYNFDDFFMRTYKFPALFVDFDALENKWTTNPNDMALINGEKVTFLPYTKIREVIFWDESPLYHVETNGKIFLISPKCTYSLEHPYLGTLVFSSDGRLILATSRDNNSYDNLILVFPINKLEHTKFVKPVEVIRNFDITKIYPENEGYHSFSGIPKIQALLSFLPTDIKKEIGCPLLIIYNNIGGNYSLVSSGQHKKFVYFDLVKDECIVSCESQSNNKFIQITKKNNHKYILKYKDKEIDSFFRNNWNPWNTKLPAIFFPNEIPFVIPNTDCRNTTLWGWKGSYFYRIDFIQKNRFCCDCPNCSRY
jgi:hypothetical protein